MKTLTLREAAEIKLKEDGYESAGSSWFGGVFVDKFENGSENIQYESDTGLWAYENEETGESYDMEFDAKRNYFVIVTEE